ncbi:hypothetical protein PAXRUDRAFT_136157, partial [Paxillus rubicundulus Ve08.2h10]
FGHPAVVQLVLQVLWKDNRYSRYLTNSRNINCFYINAVNLFRGTIIHQVLQENAVPIVTQNEFNLCDHLPTHIQHVQHIKRLQGSELDMYNALVDDVHTHAVEMRGLM